MIPTGPFGPVPLTPIAHLDRAASAFADRTAYIGGERRYTYREMQARCERLAGALQQIGVASGDVVSVLAPNTNVLLEAHFGVPMAGAVLNALNTRLSGDELAYIVGHADARVLIVDDELMDLVEPIRAAVAGLRVVAAGGPDDEYERLIAAAAADCALDADDERRCWRSTTPPAPPAGPRA